MTLAFSADPILRWTFPDPLQFMTAFKPFMALFGGKSFEHGSAHVIGDLAGVAQWLPPGVQPDEGPLGELYEQHLSVSKLGAMRSILEQMARFLPGEPHWHLAVMGVDPLYRGRGFGAQLMRRGLAACDRDRLPAYLEASSPASRTFYERLSFRVLGEIRASDSPPLFPMLREPG